MPTLIGKTMVIDVSPETFHEFNEYAKATGRLIYVNDKEALIEEMFQEIGGEMNEKKILDFIKEHA